MLIHHIDNNSVVHTIEAAGGAGVTIRTIKWDRVIGLKRPST